MQGERQAESHGAHRVPAPGGPCPHTRGLDVACESLRNRYALRHISARLLRRGGVAVTCQIGWFLAKVRDAIRMATWTRRMRRFLLNNGAASPSHPCAGKHGKTSKPLRFTNSEQEPKVCRD